MVNLIAHLEYHMTRRISLREKKEQRIGHCQLALNIYIQDMKMYSSISIL
jgi:hypothetical protein